MQRFENLSIADYLLKRADLQTAGFTKADSASEMPEGSSTLELRLTNGVPTISIYTFEGKTSDGTPYKLRSEVTKVNGIATNGVTYPNVRANIPDDVVDKLKNPEVWTKKMTGHSSNFTDKKGKVRTKTEITSVGL